MIKKLILLSLLTTIALFGEKIIIYAECEYKPYSYCESGVVKGISVDIFKSIFSKIEDYSLEVRGVDRKEAHQKMNTGEILILGKGYPATNINLLENKIDFYTNNEVAIKDAILEITKKYNDQNHSIDRIEKIISISINSYHIGFSAAPFPAKNDLIKKIDLAIKVMLSSNEISKIIDKNLKVYLNPHMKKKIAVSLYNWGGNMVSEKLTGYGVIPEIVTNAFKNRGIEVAYTFYHYKYAYLLTKWGESCMSIPWLNVGDRGEYFHFSDNIKSTSRYLVYKKEKFKDGIKYDNLSNLEKYTVGGVKGYYYEKEFFEKNKIIPYYSFPSLRVAIEELLKQNIDVIIAEKNNFASTLDTHFSHIKNELEFHKKPVFSQENYAIFSKKCENSKELKEQFNIGFKNIQKNGVMQNILKKYDLNMENYMNIKKDSHISRDNNSSK